MAKNATRWNKSSKENVDRFSLHDKTIGSVELLNTIDNQIFDYQEIKWILIEELDQKISVLDIKLKVVDLFLRYQIQFQKLDTIQLQQNIFDNENDEIRSTDDQENVIGDLSLLDTWWNTHFLDINLSIGRTKTSENFIFTISSSVSSNERENHFSFDFRWTTRNVWPHIGSRCR